MPTKTNTKNALEANLTAKLYIGLDIHKRSWKIHTSTDLFDGKTLSCPPGAPALRDYVSKHYPNHKVSIAYEAGCFGYAAHRAFESYGWRSLVVNPADISKTGKSHFQKTDTLDARLICRELKDGRLESIEIPSEEREQLRCLFRRRVTLVKDFRAIKSRIKMQLLYLGIDIPEAFDKQAKWSKAFLEWIRSQSCDYDTATATIQNELCQYEFIDGQIKQVSNQLRAYCRKNHKEDYFLLRSVPGIGKIVACGIISEMGDLRRFKNFKELASFVGLCPGVHQSGDNYRSTGMSVRGNRIMRSYFVEASWIALRYDPVLQAYWRTHQGKDPKKILIKIARKLLSRTHAVIKTGIPYQAGVVA